MANETFTTANSTAGNAYADNTTRYNVIGGSLSSLVSTETSAQVPTRRAGVFSNLYVYASANTTLVNSTVTIRKSTVDTTIIVTYASGETGIKEDTSNSASFANTDEVNAEITVSNDVSGSTAITINLIGVQFVSDTSGESATFFVNARSSSFSTDSVTRYIMAVSETSFGSTETAAQFEMRDSYTASNFYAVITSNTRTTTTTFKTRKNSADGAASVSYTSGETGAKEDTSNTDSLALSDEFSFAVTSSTGGGTIVPFTFSVNVYGTGNTFPLYSARTAGIGISSASTNYENINGLISHTTTEAAVQYYPRFDFTAKQLVTYVSLNSRNGTTNIYVRDNGADSSITVAYTSSQTGVKNDTTHSATITAVTDEINFKTVVGGTSGSITTTYYGILGETAAAATDYAPRVMMM